MTVRRTGALIALLLALTAFTVTAQDDTRVNVTDLAAYFPADTDIYAAIRTDAAYIDQLDTLASTVTDLLNNAGVPTLTLRQAATFAGMPVASIEAWLGDAVAFGVPEVETTIPPALAYLVADLDDPAAAVEFFRESGFTGSDTALEQNDLLITIDGNILIASPAPITLPTENTLLDSETFQAALADMPADEYNAIAHIGEIDEIDLLANRLLNPNDPDGFNPPLTLGLTILDDRSYVVDMRIDSGFTLDSVPGPIDPAFTARVPASANAVIHARDLASAIESLITVQQAVIDNMMTGLQMSTPPPPVNIRQGVIDGLRTEAGIDLDAEVLAWTRGELVGFSRIDVRRIAEAIVRNDISRASIEGTFDFALMAEVTDETGAAAFTEKVEAWISDGLTNGRFTEGSATAARQTILGNEFAAFTVPLNFNPSIEGEELPLTIVMGIVDGIFYLGTPGAVVDALDGGESIVDTPLFADAQTVVLPDATLLLYTDDEAALVGLGFSPVGLFGFGLLGPAVGSVFSNMVFALEGGAVITPTPTATPTPTPTPDAARVLVPLEQFITAAAHTTISVSFAESGATLARMSFSFEGGA